MQKNRSLSPLPACTRKLPERDSMVPTDHRRHCVPDTRGTKPFASSCRQSSAQQLAGKSNTGQYLAAVTRVAYRRTTRTARARSNPFRESTGKRRLQVRSPFAPAPVRRVAGSELLTVYALRSGLSSGSDHKQAQGQPEMYIHHKKSVEKE